MIPLAVFAALLVAYGPVLRELTAVWAHDHYHAHGFLVIPFSAWLLWDARGVLDGAPAWRFDGMALAAGALAMLLTGVASGSLPLKALSIPLAAAGLAVLGLGRRRAGAIAFPLAFLVFLVPLPAAAIAALSAPLQALAVGFTHGVLQLLDIPVTREGLFLRLDTVTLHVSEACNGLRFLLAMIVLGAAVARLTQRRTRDRLVVMAGAVALAIVGNLLRVAATAVLADRYGADAVAGLAHLVLGKAVYAVILVVFFALVLALRGRRPAAMEVTA